MLHNIRFLNAKNTLFIFAKSCSLILWCSRSLWCKLSIIVLSDFYTNSISKINCSQIRVLRFVLSSTKRKLHKCVCKFPGRNICLHIVIISWIGNKIYFAHTCFYHIWHGCKFYFLLQKSFHSNFVCCI